MINKKKFFLFQILGHIWKTSLVLVVFQLDFGEKVINTFIITEIW
jgi:hypothetical protein